MTEVTRDRTDQGPKWPHTQSNFRFGIGEKSPVCANVSVVERKEYGSDRLYVCNENVKS